MKTFKKYLNESSTPRAYSLSNIRVTKDGTIFLRPIGIIEDVIKMAVDMEEQGDDEFLIAIINVISPLKLIKEINKSIMKDRNFFENFNDFVEHADLGLAEEELHAAISEYVDGYLERLSQREEYQYLKLADDIGILDK